MFINDQDSDSKTYYERMLKAAGSLSNLFSDKTEPYLGYRLVENLFCKSFNAENLSRHDTSVDASKNNFGIGIKTFLYKNGKTFEKVAEFNKHMDLFKGLPAEEKMLKVAELRNERLSLAKRTYALERMIYHCVTRAKGRIMVYEIPMESINLEKIKNVSLKNNSIRFEDTTNTYLFNISKSTLFKQFSSHEILLDFPVKIISDPFEALDKLFRDAIKELVFTPIKQIPHVFLPFYSIKDGEKYVPEKSSLNQWNAAGRPRGMNEVYLQIPAWVHKKYPLFFPDRDTKFNLKVPNKSELKVKVCQQGSKALMSDPNSALGEWLLRDILQLNDGEILTYEKLESLGLDSVVIYRHSEQDYSIDFAKIGSYEEFSDQPENSPLTADE